MPVSAPVRFAISQGHGGSTVLEGARVFAKTLGARLNQTVRLAVAEGYSALYRMLLQKGCEVAWVPPFVHMAAIGQGAHIAVVCERGGALTYRSALVVNADDTRLRTIQDLRIPGLRVAWTDPHSASGYVFPRVFLATQGIDPVGLDERFVGSPLSACAAVADKQADFCACFVSESSAADPDQVLADVRRIYSAAPWRLRVLAITDPIPSDAIMLAPHVDEVLAERITEALLGFHTVAEGREALAKLLFAEKMVAPPPDLLLHIETLRPHMPPVEP